MNVIPSKIEITIYVGACEWGNVEEWKDVAPPPVRVTMEDQVLLGNITEIDQDEETRELWHLTIENIRPA